MDKNTVEGPEAYPRPNKADQQINNQPEYVDQQPNDFHDKSISDLPTEADKQSNDPSKELKDSD